MINFEKASSFIFAFCVLQWSMCKVESATNAATSNSKTVSSDDKERGVSSSLLDSIYRKSRQSRCVTCYEDRRYGDDRKRYYSNYAARSGDDRTNSWYYPNYDRYDDRGYRGSEYDRYGADRYEGDRSGAYRYGGDRYGGDRYGANSYGTGDRYGYRDDRYGFRPSYDRYDTRTRVPYERPSSAYDRGESRGYNYDNRDRYYGSDRDSAYYYGRDRYYDRSRYGATSAGGYSSGQGGYDPNTYDRYSTRYDFRQYRPWDDTESGQTGYDNSGQGYYYGKGNQDDRRYLPDAGISPCGIRKPNCPHHSPEDGTRVTSNAIDSGHYNVGVSQTTYSTNSNTNHNESSKGSGSLGNWSYMREEDEQPSRGGSNSGSNSDRDRNSDKQSSGYGALLDRGTNLIAVEPVQTNENANDSTASSDKQKDKSSDETPKHSGNGQNS